jgi:hypothetical protein
MANVTDLTMRRQDGQAKQNDTSPPQVRLSHSSGQSAAGLGHPDHAVRQGFDPSRIVFAGDVAADSRIAAGTPLVRCEFPLLCS